MGQHLARREVEEGLRLYNQQHYDGAIRKWKRALHKIKHRGDRFATLGYLASAHCDCGKYRDMLAYGIMQIDIANEAESSNMRAEAYLCLARSNERLCDYHKAVSYSRHCLQNQPRDSRVHGYVYLCQANAYVGFGFFTKALENLELAMRISKECDDPALELQVFITMGHIFVMLKDYEKGLGFHLKATELSKSFKVCDVSTKYQRLAYYHLAAALTELGRCEEAYSCCQDAMPMAIAEGDKPTQARCTKIIGDVERKQEQYQKSLECYEEALSILTEVGDRAGQVEVLLGRAETLHYTDMHTLALSNIDRATDLAHMISNKILIYKCHHLKEDIYTCLGDDAVAKEQQNHCYAVLDEMNLFCALCSCPFGDRQCSLEPLTCFHIVHTRCIESSNSMQFLQEWVDAASKQCNKCCKINPKGSVTPSRLSPQSSRDHDHLNFPSVSHYASTSRLEVKRSSTQENGNGKPMQQCDVKRVSVTSTTSNRASVAPINDNRLDIVPFVPKATSNVAIAPATCNSQDMEDIEKT